MYVRNVRTVFSVVRIQSTTHILQVHVEGRMALTERYAMLIAEAKYKIAKHAHSAGAVSRKMFNFDSICDTQTSILQKASLYTLRNTRIIVYL